MKNTSLIAKISAYLSLTSGIIWFGSYITRLGVTYQLFEEDGIQFKSFVSPESLEAITSLLSPTIFLSFFSYLIFIIAFSQFLFTAKINIKNNGWLLIISLIIFLTMPFEIYLMTIDWDLIKLFYAESRNYSQLLNLVIDRIRNLEGFSLVIIICYLTIPFMLLFQPFTLKKSIDEN
jgi:hypothetical protein